MCCKWGGSRGFVQWIHLIEFCSGRGAHLPYALRGTKRGSGNCAGGAIGNGGTDLLCGDVKLEPRIACLFNFLDPMLPRFRHSRFLVGPAGTKAAGSEAACSAFMLFVRCVGDLVIAFICPPERVESLDVKRSALFVELRSHALVAAWCSNIQLSRRGAERKRLDDGTARPLEKRSHHFAHRARLPPRAFAVTVLSGIGRRLIVLWQEGGARYCRERACAAVCCGWLYQ